MSSAPVPDMTPLARRIADRLRASGPVPFASFMAMALYDAELGYYAVNTARTGRAGDFYTSVSTGAAFGELMAGQFAEAWGLAGKPDGFTVIEAGANDGRFAEDVLTWTRDRRPDFHAALRYRIDEPSPHAAAVQRERLAAFPGKVDHRPAPAECGVFFANEVLDAIPFRRVRWHAEPAHWQEICVGVDEAGALCEVERAPEDRTLLRRLGEIGTEFPDGYTTEIAPAVASEIRLAAGRLRRGWFFFFDYGYIAPDYYAPGRTTGTLRCYRAHTAHENPYAEVGETDITAHVDFSFAARAAETSGLELLAFLDQGRFLTGAAQDRLREMEGRPPDAAARQWLRQFQTLTHPGHMGAQFHALVLGRDVPDGLLSGLTFARPGAVEALRAPVRA